MNLRDQFLEVQKSMGPAIIGQATVIERLMIALLANGNVLREGLPGTARTRSIKTLSRLIETEFRRVQFTPDSVAFRCDRLGDLPRAKRNVRVPARAAVRHPGVSR